MKRRLFALALFLGTPFFSLSQFYEGFSKSSLDDWIQSPSNRWSVVNDEMFNSALHHNYDSKSNGRDYITKNVNVPNYVNGKLEWTFRVKFTYPSSSGNGWAFILASDGDAGALDRSLLSHCLLIGVNVSGSDDMLKVWEQTVSSSGEKNMTLIASSSLNWEESVGNSSYGYIKVTRNADCSWNIGYSHSSFSRTKSISSFSYSKALPLNNLGLVYWYTSSADRKLWIDDVSLSFSETNVVDKDSELSLVSAADTVISSKNVSRVASVSSFTVKDKGTSDGLPTVISALNGYIQFKPFAMFDCQNWYNAFHLYEDGKELASTVTFSDSLFSIVLNRPDTIANGLSKRYSLKLDLPKSLADRASFCLNYDFLHPITSPSNSSLVGACLHNTSRRVEFDANADHFIMIPDVTHIELGTGICPTFAAVDRNGIVDVDFCNSCVFSLGDIGSPKSYSAMLGRVAVDELSFSGKSYVDITLQSQGLKTFSRRLFALHDVSSSVVRGEVDTLVASSSCSCAEQAVSVASFTIKDKGGDGTPTDARSFAFDLLTSKVDAPKVIAGVVLAVNGKETACRIAKLTKDCMTVEVPSGVVTVGDGESASVDVGLFFSPDLIVDHASMAFSLSSVAADSSGSLFSSFSPMPLNVVNFSVVADTLMFSRFPSVVLPHGHLDVTVKATDAFGNVDVDYGESCMLSFNGEGTIVHRASFVAGVTKFSGISIARCGAYEVEASSEGLRTTKPLFVADSDSYLKVFSLKTNESVDGSTSRFVKLLDFSVVDTGVSDTLDTRITQLTLQGVDTLGRLITSRRIDSVEVFCNERKVLVSDISFSSGKMLLKLADSPIVVPNGKEVEVAVYARLSMVSDMSPFFLTLPAGGVSVDDASSFLSKAHSYPIRSARILFRIMPEQVLFSPHPIVVLKSHPVNLKCWLANAEGYKASCFVGKVSAAFDGFSPVDPLVKNGCVAIEGSRAIRTGKGAITVSAEGVPPEVLFFDIEDRVDSLVRPFSSPSHKSGWSEGDRGGFVHSGDEGRSVLLYNLPPDASSRSTQWHFNLRLSNENFSSENFMRLVLLSDAVPCKDSAYSAVVLSYKKCKSRYFFQLESLAKDRVVVCSDTIISKSIVGRMTEVYISRSDDGLWSGDVYADGLRCAHFASVSLPPVSAPRYCGVVYQCSPSNIGKMALEEMDVVGSEPRLAINDGYFSSKGNALLKVNMPLSSRDGITVSAFDKQGQAVAVSNLAVDGCNVTFLLSDVKESAYDVRLYYLKDGSRAFVSFPIHVRAGLEFGDVAISEIMFDPSPSVGLPEVEYLELYNRVSDTLSIKDWTIRVNGKVWRCGAARIAPLGFVAISSSSGSALLRPYGSAVGAVNFDGLSNEGANIAVLNPSGKVMAFSCYNESFLASKGIKGGVSIERSDLNSMCEGEEAWLPSVDAKGGTPGAANSVAASVVDDAAPYVVLLRADSLSVDVVFNEPVVAHGSPSLLVDGALFDASFFVEEMNPRHLTVRFSSELERNRCYSLMLSGISDYAGNTMSEPIMVALCDAPARGEVVINEVLFNPDGLCSDYVELLNCSKRPVDLAGLAICRRNADGALDEIKHVSLSSSILKPNELALLCSTPQAIATRYPKSDSRRFVVLSSMPSFPNETGDVVVIDTALNVVDEVVYKESMHYKMLPTVEGVSLERVSPMASEWISASKEVCYGTPGVENSQSLSVQCSDEMIQLVSSSVSPDNNGVNDCLEILYNVKEAGVSADVRIYSSKGVLAKVLCRNELLGTKGLLVWDGVTDGGVRASRDVYILMAKLIFPDGRIRDLKKAFSIVYR